MKRAAWWPSVREEALVRLALGVSFNDQETQAILLDAIDAPSPEEERLLPVLYRRLYLDSDNEELWTTAAARMVEARLRLAWIDSRVRRAQALLEAHQVLAALSAGEISVAPLKGLAFAAWYDCMGRPIGDLDLLVPAGQLEAAVRRLEQLGYQPHEETNPQSPRAKHSCALARATGLEVDLHWLLDVRLMGRSRSDEPMGRFWRRASVVEWAGHRLHRLRSEHHLLHAVIHGARVDSRAEARWAVDAITILRSEGSRFDWDELVGTTLDVGLGSWMSPALAWLDHLVPDLVPISALRAFRNYPVPLAERCLWWLDSHTVGAGIRLDVHRTLRWHLARTRSAGLLRGLFTYPGWLTASGLVGSPRQLIVHWKRRRRERRARQNA